MLLRRAAALFCAACVSLLAGCSDTGSDLAGDRTPAAAPSPTATPSSSAPTSAATSPSASAPPAPSAPSALPTAAGTRALFFGDSYFVGGGTTTADNSMAADAARDLGWDPVIKGGGGTGFVSGNPEFGLENFIGQIRGGALDVGPVSWLVIEGGGNDKDDDPATIQQRAVEVLQEAASEHPEAQLVLVGTLDPTVDGFTDTDGVIGALRAAAEQQGVPYVDAQRWLEGRPELIGPDFDHPTADGHLLAGRKLADALLAIAAGS